MLARPIFALGSLRRLLGAAFKRELGVGIVVYRNRLRVRRFLELAVRVFVAATGQAPRDYLAARAAVTSPDAR